MSQVTTETEDLLEWQQDDSEWLLTISAGTKR